MSPRRFAVNRTWSTLPQVTIKVLMTLAPNTGSTGLKAISLAVRSTYLAFVTAGFAFASWASRIPQVRTQLGLSSAQLGLLLLAIAVGSVFSLAAAGAMVHRFGSRHTVQVAAAVLAASFLVIGLGYLSGVVPVAVGLFVLGVANGAWDVAMNVHAARVERLVGRSIMPRFHAGFSVGTVAGALLGAAMIALHVPVTAHFLGIAVVIVATVPLGVRRFVSDAVGEPDAPDAADDAAAPTGHHGAFARWREPRTLLVGLFVLCFAFAEGTGNDWISVSLIDGHHAAQVVGTLGFATFLVAMTVGRWFGGPLLDRYGRVVALRLLASLAVAGVLLYVFSPVVWLAFVGTLVWGLGASLGFPVGMSAAADDPAAAAGRVSTVASVGYGAFLIGPPLIGFLGEHSSVLHALTVVAAALALASVIAGALRPLGQPARDATDIHDVRMR